MSKCSDVGVFLGEGERVGGEAVLGVSQGWVAF